MKLSKSFKFIIATMVILVVFILAKPLALTGPQAKTPKVVRFKVVDYDPSTMLLILRPTRKPMIQIEYKPDSELRKWPKLLQKVGKKVNCEVFKVHLGYWVSLDGIKGQLHTNALRCDGEVFYMTDVLVVDEEEYGRMMRKRLKRVTGK